MQVVMKVFTPKSWKKLVQIRLVILEKNTKNVHLISKNDVAESKARLLK